MTHPEPRRGIVLVDGAGRLSWWSADLPLIAETTVSVGRGTAVRVDAADARVVAWVVEPEGDTEALAAAFGDPALATRLRELAAGGEFVGTTPEFELTLTWTRCAVVKSVARWSLRRVHEGALFLDEAAALQRAGDDAGAARLFGLGLPTLTAFAQDCADGYLDGGAATELRDIVSSAALALPGDTEVLTATALLAEVAARDDARWAATLAQWTIESPLFTTPVAATLGEHDDAEPDVFAGSVDPQVVPPRVLAWPGADEPDLHVRYDAAAGTLTITAVLATDPDVAEAHELLAYLAARDTGALLATAPLTVTEDGRVTAQLSSSGTDPDDLVVGVLGAGSDPAELRLRPGDEHLIAADRWLLQAWNLVRGAGLQVYRPAGFVAAGADSVHESQLRDAKTAIDNAIGSLERFLRANDAGNDVVRNKIGNLRRYASSLDAAIDTPRRPLLAELVTTDEDG